MFWSSAGPKTQCNTHSKLIKENGKDHFDAEVIFPVQTEFVSTPVCAKCAAWRYRRNGIVGEVFLCGEQQTAWSAGTKVHLAGRKLQLRKTISHEEADPCRGVRTQLTAVFMGNKPVLASSLCPMTMAAETQAWFGGSLPSSSGRGGLERAGRRSSMEGFASCAQACGLPLSNGL